MFARTPTFRAAALFVSAALTAVMLGGIDGLAVTQHADYAFAKAQTQAAPAAVAATAAATLGQRG